MPNRKKDSSDFFEDVDHGPFGCFPSSNNGCCVIDLYWLVGIFFTLLKQWYKIVGSCVGPANNLSGQIYLCAYWQTIL